MAKTMKKSDVLFGGAAYPILKALRAWGDLEKLGTAFAGKKPSGPLSAAKKVAGVSNQLLIKGELVEAYCKAGFIGNNLVVRIKTKKAGLRGKTGYTRTDFQLAKNCRGNQAGQQKKKKGGPSQKVTILQNELMGMLQRTCSPTNLNLTKTRVGFELTMIASAEVFDALDDDPLLLAKVTEAASAEYNKFCKAMEKRLKTIDKSMTGLSSKQKKAKRDAFAKEVKSAAATLEKASAKAAQAALKKFKKTKTSYRDYKISIGVKVVSDVTNLGCAVTCAVTSGGWGLAVALYGAVKSAIDLTRTLVKAARDAGKQRKVAERFLKEIVQQWEWCMDTSEFNQNEAGVVLVNHFLKLGLPTVSKAEGEVTTYGHKLEGVDLNAHKSSRHLNGALRSLDKFEASLKGISDPTLKKNLKAHTKKVRKCSFDLIEAVIKMQEQVNEGGQFVKKANKKIKVLKAKKSKVVDWMEKGLFLTDLALGGSTISWDSTTKAAQKAGDLLLNVIDPFLAEVEANMADKLQ